MTLCKLQKLSSKSWYIFSDIRPMNFVIHEGLSMLKIDNLIRNISIKKVNFKFVKLLDDTSLWKYLQFKLLEKNLIVEPKIILN